MKLVKLEQELSVTTSVLQAIFLNKTVELML